jgi:dihydroorotase
LPENSDNKICEFEHAANGMIGLETVFGVVLRTGCSLDRFIEMQTVKNRQLFGLPLPEIKVGAPARLTILDPTTNWILTPDKIVSKSKNSAFTGIPLKGKVWGIINGDKTVLHS